ncbi:hypothetical protein QRX50_20055 [Amycolatopsis carbonis]|uniref:Uncharacterized protein n=1 Tax=Amycolatopsis carbonis TaxID=715471 RepID=A0A9Y2IR66_9PSEU|nr:hypothetical protein [Amycolatopsis sp. 2-15]WIX83974.1 hypothetical protein QRX50_20055 [Amycolatopsis sp. 2-15]
MTYLPGRQPDATQRLLRRGVVAGSTVFDAYTETQWVTVRAEITAQDTEPEWVRADNIVDVVPVS